VLSRARCSALARGVEEAGLCSDCLFLPSFGPSRLLPPANQSSKPDLTSDTYWKLEYTTRALMSRETGRVSCKIETISFPLAQDGHILGHSFGMCLSFGSSMALVKRSCASLWETGEEKAICASTLTVATYVALFAAFFHHKGCLATFRAQIGPGKEGRTMGFVFQVG
jgi:hypothetical protein